MDIEMLKEVVPMLAQQLEKCQADRNWTQLERDTVQTFYDVTRGEVGELEMKIAAKDRMMELMEDNHRVEVRVYVQKVKHLEYEHKNNLKGIEMDSNQFSNDEYAASDQRITSHKDNKRSLKEELRERDLNNAEEIRSVKQQHEKILQQVRDNI